MSIQHLEETIPSKPEVLVLVGLPASGKTTYAREWLLEDPTHRMRINFDDLRLELYGPQWVFNYSQEKLMKIEAYSRADMALRAGKSVVIDNTNLTEKAREPWIKLAHSHGIKPELFEIDTPVAECIRRDELRTGTARVGREVIERFALDCGFKIGDSDEQL